MRLGLLADIHEDLPNLAWAVRRLRDAGVDRWVSLGDLCDDGSRIAEACEVLRGLEAVSVWGNHDYGLCTSPIAQLKERFGDSVIEYMRTCRARIVIEDCSFTHIEPGLDANDLADLWTLPPDVGSNAWLERNWAAAPARRCFFGHLHRWFAASGREGVLGWPEGGPLSTAGEDRFLFVLDAVRNGCCAWLDTGTGELRAFDRRWER